MLQTEFLFVGGSWDGRRQAMEKASPVYCVPVSAPKQHVIYVESEIPEGPIEVRTEYYKLMPWQADQTDMYLYALECLSPEEVLWMLINGYKGKVK